MTQISRDEFANLYKEAPKGTDPEELIKVLQERGHTLEGLANPSPTAQQSQFQSKLESMKPTAGIFDAIGKGWENIKTGIQKSGEELATTMESNVNPALKVIKGATTITKGIINPFVEAGIATPLRVGGEIAQNVTGIDVNEAVSQGTQKLVQKGMDTETAQKVMRGWADLKERDPESAMAMSSLLDIADIASNVVGLKGAGIVAKPLEGVAKKGVEATKEGLGKVATGAGKITEFGVAQATGLSPNTIKNIVAHPEVFSAEELAKVDRESIGNKVLSAVKGRQESLRATGKEYESIRQMTQPVNIPKEEISSVLDKYRINVDENGKIITTAESLPMSEADKNALQTFLNTYYTGNDVMTPNAMLNARTVLSNMAGFESGKTGAVKTLSKELRKVMDTSMKSQIPELAVLDAKFAPEKQFLSKVTKDLFNRDGTVKDNAYSKLANLTGKGKEKLLERMESVVPGITQDVNILKAIEDIEYAQGQKVGAYMRAGGALVGASTAGPVGAVIGAIVSSPTVAVELLRTYGKIKNISSKVINSITEKMQSGKKLFDKEKAIFESAINEKASKAMDKLKNTPAGLSIKDVSGGKPGYSPESIAKNIDGADLTIMKTFVDDFHSKGGQNVKAYSDAYALAENMGIKTKDLSPSQLADKIGEILTATESRFTPKRTTTPQFEQKTASDTKTPTKTESPNKSLIEEAKKYGSEEEFIREQPKIFRYGTEIDKKRGLNRGISFTKTAQEAIDYGQGVGGAIRIGGSIHSAVLDKSANILKEEDIPSGLLNSKEQDYDSLIKYARKNGYDAVEIGNVAGENEIRVLNPNKLTTQSELSAIYKQAHGKAKIKSFTKKK